MSQNGRQGGTTSVYLSFETQTALGNVTEMTGVSRSQFIENAVRGVLSGGLVKAAAPAPDAGAAPVPEGDEKNPSRERG